MGYPLSIFFITLKKLFAAPGQVGRWGASNHMPPKQFANNSMAAAWDMTTGSCKPSLEFSYVFKAGTPLGMSSLGFPP